MAEEARWTKTKHWASMFGFLDQRRFKVAIKHLLPARERESAVGTEAGKLTATEHYVDFIVVCCF